LQPRTDNVLTQRSVNSFAEVLMDDDEAFGRGFNVGEQLSFACGIFANLGTVQQTFGIEVDFLGQAVAVLSLGTCADRTRDGQN
jgi:hypothetical protein